MGLCGLNKILLLVFFWSHLGVAEEKTDNDTALMRLQSTFIGDKEQPSVSYFIPWKGTSAPDDLRWRIKRKNDDTLGIVDREIMLRSISIYDEMNFESTDK
ncbi:MAG: hypothetical protein KTR20_02985 [Cellvibrionaceae bacterium]|nr:hypothetical protein [Cellvibrionaceae bacterium]